MKSIVLASVLASSLASCYKTTYELRPPPLIARPASQHFHLGLIGFIELSSPIVLTSECGGPEQASLIFERVGVLGGVVNLVLGTFIPILHVHNATVGCSPVAGP
jgi:hypothetical protein